MKTQHWLFMVIIALSAVSIMAIPGRAQDIVYCQKMGDLSGQVYVFDGYCPIGYLEVK